MLFWVYFSAHDLPNHLAALPLASRWLEGNCLSAEMSKEASFMRQER